MGIEAGDEEMRNKILKRNMKDSMIIEACSIIKKSGLRLATQNIVGAPGSSLEKDFTTMRLNALCKTDYAWCTLYQPYPGVELTDLAISLNLFDGNRATISNSFHNTSILNIPNKTEVTNLHKLFGIASEFPKLERLIKALIKIKFLTPAYSVIRKFWNVYCYKFRICRNIKWSDLIAKACRKKI